MKNIASIDFSINSTCMCVFSGDGYSWHHFSRDGMKYFDIGSKFFKTQTFSKRESKSDYCSTERMKVVDAQTLCSSIVKTLEKNRVDAIAFEGHSFNSKGNSLLELVSYQFLLRNMIIRDLNFSPNALFFYSPVTVKAFAGGARYKKTDMLNAFLECDDELLQKNPVYIKLKTQSDQLIKKDNVIKPIDDLVDSYWIVKKLQQDV